MQKKELVFFICLIVSIIGCNQENKPEPQNESGTKLEKFVSRKGITFVRDLYHIKPDISNSSNKALKLEGVVIYEPDKENERLKGLKINVCEKKPAEESEPLACTDYWYLDLDEVENLSKALEYIREFSNEWKNVQREDTSVTYMSKGDFIIRFNQWDTNQEVYLPYQNNKEKFFFDNIDSLAAFKEQVDNSLKLIREK
jgi:hypothetical protein